MLREFPFSDGLLLEQKTAFPPKLYLALLDYWQIIHSTE